VAGYASRNGAASNARRERARRVVALAYILAVAIPPIGLALGIVIAVRFHNVRPWHGVAIIVTSIVASLVWIVIITSGALNTPTSGY
jgi:ABC-type Fe3+ transport system permease subunit